jgi:hypothetical protein
VAQAKIELGKGNIWGRAHMNEHVIITALVVMDAVMSELGHESHKLAVVSDAEIVPVVRL